MTHRFCLLLNLMDLADMQWWIHMNIACVPTQCVFPRESHDTHSSAGKEPWASWARLVHSGWALQAAGTPQESVDCVSSARKPTRAESMGTGWKKNDTTGRWISHSAILGPALSLMSCVTLNKRLLLFGSSVHTCQWGLGLAGLQNPFQDWCSGILWSVWRLQTSVEGSR